MPSAQERQANKSVLANVPQICGTCHKTETEHVGSFPCGFGSYSGTPKTIPIKPVGKLLPKISECPKCGSPIYGPSGVFQDEKPEMVFSCECRKIPTVRFPDTVETK